MNAVAGTGACGTSHIHTELTQWVVNKKEEQIHGQLSFKTLLFLALLRTRRG